MLLTTGGLLLFSIMGGLLILFSLNGVVYLSPMHRYTPRRGNSQPHLIAAHIYDGDLDIVTYHNGFIFLSAQNQHFQLLLQVGLTTYITKQIPPLFTPLPLSVACDKGMKVKCAPAHVISSANSGGENNQFCFCSSRPMHLWDGRCVSV